MTNPSMRVGDRDYNLLLNDKQIHVKCGKGNVVNWSILTCYKKKYKTNSKLSKGIW